MEFECERSEVDLWCQENGLSSDVQRVLDEAGFHTLDELKLLTEQDVKESLQAPGLLNLAQSLSLKKALKCIAVSSVLASQQITDISKVERSALWETPKLQLPASPDCTSHGLDVYYGPETDHPVKNESCQGNPSPVPHSAAPGSDSYGLGKNESCQGNPSPVPQSAATGTDSYGLGTSSSSGTSSLSSPSVPERFYRFLLVGKTGSGKSTTGNSILGENLFDGDVGFDSQTIRNQLKRGRVGDAMVEIMDCPGLFDTCRSHEAISMDIVRAVACMHPGPHAVLYVIRLGRYTQEEFEVYQRLKAVFDDNLARHLIVIFTGADDLEKNGKSFGEVLSHVPANLAQVLADCQRRVVAFNNVAKDKKPYVRHLLQQVDQLLQQNGGRHYECPRYATVGEGLQEEIAKRLQQLEEEQLANNKFVQKLQTETTSLKAAIEKAKKLLEERQRQHQLRLMEEEGKAKVAMEMLEEEMKKKDVSMEQQQLEMKKLQQQHRAAKEKLEQELKQIEAQGRMEFQRKQQEFQVLMKKLQSEKDKAAEDTRRQYERELRRMKDKIASADKPPSFLQKVCNTIVNVVADVVVPAFVGKFTSKLLPAKKP